ncbi:tRNA 5-methylaminomethyl-2-thiouridine biosynthesis bifunctional protein MnmC [bacterium HR39]|nr:tRNA 5-methylaminomethyl-2-thiouridine biosynthesis bifunctional protein MnmC [bacterium HR39]
MDRPKTRPLPRPLDIAVVGAGVAGLGCAWWLARRHRVTLYEKERRPGGHSCTLEVEGADGRPIAVDIGFIVFNEPNYPLLTRLFRTLAIATMPTDMSFAVSLDDGAFEYGGGDWGALFAQKRNLVRPGFWRMCIDILRFFRKGRAAADDPTLDGLTLGEWLRRERFGPAFVHRHILPMAAAIWSAPLAEIAGYPARSFLTFFRNHGLLQLEGRPQWRTVAGGSRRYVEALVADGGFRLRTGGVAAVLRDSDGVTVIGSDGSRARHDIVVLATHADTSLRLLADADRDELSLLSSFRYTSNTVVLHGDPALMPKRRRVWSSWNYVGRSRDPATRRVAVTYWMNRLQHLPAHTPLFATVNPWREPDPRLVHAVRTFDHPVFDFAALAAQKRLPQLQGRRRT